jgi:hypothetical protein
MWIIVSIISVSASVIYLWHKGYIAISLGKKKDHQAEKYAQHLETKVHLFNFGMQGIEDVEDITDKNLEIVEYQDKPCVVRFLLHPNESHQALQQKFYAISYRRDLTDCPKKLYCVDVEMQKAMYENKVWAFTGKLVATEQQIIFVGVALREEKDDNKNGSPEEIYDPVCPEKLVCV